MDVGMPRLNGYDATRRIRAQSWGRTSRYCCPHRLEDRRGTKLKSKEAGCDGHLVKPVSLADLEKTLERTRTFKSWGLTCSSRSSWAVGQTFLSGRHRQECLCQLMILRLLNYSYRPASGPSAFRRGLLQGDAFKMRQGGMPPFR